MAEIGESRYQIFPKKIAFFFANSMQFLASITHDFPGVGLFCSDSLCPFGVCGYQPFKPPHFHAVNKCLSIMRNSPCTYIGPDTLWQLGPDKFHQIMFARLKNENSKRSNFFTFVLDGFG